MVFVLVPEIYPKKREKKRRVRDFVNVSKYCTNVLEIVNDYLSNMSTITFLLQATRILHVGNYDEDELRMIYDFTTQLDNVVLNEYLNNTTILSYNNDLELYVEILQSLINIFEGREEYEKCNLLKIKIEESIKLIKTK
jgi:hypothetical protein